MIVDLAQMLKITEGGDYLTMSKVDARMTAVGSNAELRRAARCDDQAVFRQRIRRMMHSQRLMSFTGDPKMSSVNPAILAAALLLSRLHGARFAAFFLLDRGVSSDVIRELLFDSLSIDGSIGE